MSSLIQSLASLPIRARKILTASKRARQHLIDFTVATYSTYKPNWHHRVVAHYLEQVASGQIRRLIIMLPPRMGKSELSSIRFPAWYLGRYPHKKIILGSYADSFAVYFGRKTRNVIASPVFQGIFPLAKLSADSTAADRWELTAGGGFVAVGRGGAITGRGAHCFPSWVKIATEIGEIPIKVLANMLIRPRVFSYNHQTNRIVLAKINAINIRHVDEYYEMRTIKGKILHGTGEHPIYILNKKSYNNLNTLQIGDIVATLKSFDYFEMCNVRNFISTHSLQSFKKPEKRAQEFLLFINMRKQMASDQNYPLSGMWQTQNRQTHPYVLFQGMPTTCTGQKEKTNSLWFLPEAISSATFPNTFLLSSMCQQSSFNSHDGTEQFPLQKWKQLYEMVYRDDSADFREGPISLQGVFVPTENNDLSYQMGQKNEIIFSCSSYRCQSFKQCSREPDNPMPCLPHNSSQIEADTISMVQRICGKSIDVYDLEVEGTHNYFAEGILVHNCLILDDLIKNVQEAYSQHMRDLIWDWYTSTAYTRLEENGAIVIVQTRWHQDDIIGRLLKYEPEKWTVVSLPAIAEKMEDWGIHVRNEGEGLWESKYPLTELLEIKKTLGKYWSAIYQQNPLAVEGNLVKREWFTYYKEPPKGYLRVIQSWDTAFKQKTLNDYSVCTTWGETAKNYYLLDMWRGRVEFPELKKQVVMLAKKFNPHLILIEDHASGQSLIQELKRETRLPIKPVRVDKDKVSRFSAITPLIETGLVCFPDPAYHNAPWLADFTDELLAFPSGAHDDICDSVSQALTYMRKKEGPQIRWL